MTNELRDLVAVGCRPMQALRAATGWAAEAMGWEDIGTLAPGKLADLVAVDGEPLADIEAMRKVALVLREGVVVKRDQDAKGRVAVSSVYQQRLQHLAAVAQCAEGIDETDGQRPLPNTFAKEDGRHFHGVLGSSRSRSAANEGFAGVGHAGLQHQQVGCSGRPVSRHNHQVPAQILIW